MTVRGFFVPYRDADGVTYVTYKLKPHDTKFWRSALLSDKGLRGFLLAAKPTLNGLCEEEALETVGDLMVLFFKAPLYRETLPGFTLSPYKLLLSWVLLRARLRELPSLKEFIHEVRKSKHPAVELVDDPRIMESAERTLLLYPSDTRPGPNTTALIPHLMLTSAITWSLAVKDGYTRRDRAYLRLAALLHDIGKPIDPKRHVEESVKITHELLCDILSSGCVGRVVELVKRHHKAGVEVGIIAKADGIASADRLYRLVKATIAPRIEELARARDFEGFEDAWRSWEFWETVSNEEIEGLTKEFMNKVRDALREVRPRTYEDMLVAEVDFGGIQDSVKEVEFLENLASVSHLIDILQIFLVPARAQVETAREGLGWLPAECVFRAGGGGVSFVLPNDDRVVKACERAAEQAEVDGPPAIKVRFAATALAFPYPLTAAKLGKQIGLVKITLSDRSIASQFTGLEAICQLCYKRPAIKVESRRREEYYVCSACSSSLSFARKYSLKMKWLEVRDPTTGVSAQNALGSWQDAAPYVIEVLAGHDVAEFKNGRAPPRLLNIAVIKFDGNAMGSFFAKAMSFSDAVERSLRVDWALKRAHMKAIEELGKAVGDNAGWKLRVAIGTIYLGGDDGLVIMPSWAALPYAETLCREFSLNLGNECTLSVGIVAASPRQSLWQLIDSADELLETAKKRGRELPRGAYGAIAYDVGDGTIITRHSVESRFSALESAGITEQPLIVAEQAVVVRRSLSNIIELVLGETVKGSEFFSKAYEVFLLLREGRAEGIAKRVKDVRATLQELATILLSSKEGGAMAFTYTARQSARLGGVYMLLPIYLAELVEGGSAPLADALLMAKLLGGGML